MDNIAGVGIAVDSSSVLRAEKALGSFAAAGDRAVRTSKTSQTSIQGAFSATFAAVNRGGAAFRSHTDAIAASVRQSRLYELAASGANAAQLRLAAGILKANEAYRKQSQLQPTGQQRGPDGRFIGGGGGGGGSSGGGIGLGTIVKGGAIAMAAREVMGGAAEYLQTADAMASMTARMSMVIPNAIALKDAQDALFASAQKTGSGYLEVAGMFATMMGATKELGAGQTDVVRFSETVSKAIKLTGANAQQTKSAIEQLGQAMGSGSLSGDELKSIKENAPGLAAAIASGLGVSIGKLKEMGAEGQLTSEKVFGALMKAANEVDAKFDKLPSTFAQGTERIANSAKAWIDEIEKITGAASGLGGMLTNASKAMDSIRKNGLGSVLGGDNGDNLPANLVQGATTNDLGYLFTPKDRARVAAYGSRKGGPSGIVTDPGKQRENLVAFNKKYETPAEARNRITLETQHQVGFENFTPAMAKRINDAHKDPKAEKTPKTKGLDAFEHMLDAAKRDNDAFGMPEVEKKIIDLQNKFEDLKGKGDPNKLAGGIQLLRGTQAKHDDKVRSNYNFEKGLESEERALQRASEAYGDNVEHQRAMLDAKLIKQSEFDAFMKTSVAGQIETIQRHTSVEVASIAIRLAAARTIEEKIALEEKMSQVVQKQTDAVDALTRSEANRARAEAVKIATDRKAVMDEELSPQARFDKRKEELEKLKLPEDVMAKQLRRAWAEVGDEINKAGKSISAMDDLGRIAAAGISKNLGSGVRAMVSGEYKEMGKAWSTMIEDMLSEAITAQLMKALMGDRPGSVGGGGLLDTFMGYLGGSSGKSGPSTSSTASGGSGGGSFFSSVISGVGGWLSGLMGKADGGRPAQREATIVGENGPELFVPDSAGRITSNRELNSGGGGSSYAGAGGGGPHIEVRIINNGEKMEAQSQTLTQTDTGWLAEVIVSTMVNDAASGGRHARQFEGTYKLNRAAGLPV